MTCAQSYRWNETRWAWPKGYGERAGLASGQLLLYLGVVIWIFWPAREDSVWKKDGPFGHKPRGERGG